MWETFIKRYQGGEWRARIFRDMILDDAARRGQRLTFVDIGCGHGFDGDTPLQQSIAQTAGRYVGIEPDATIQLGDYFAEKHNCFFEHAPIQTAQADVALCIMVLEHLPDPQAFFDKLYDILVPGGVFWALTPDGRHWYSRASVMSEKLHIKDFYLNMLHGRRGTERYENYPAFYRCNTPDDIRRYARKFSQCDCISLARVGQCNPYFPRVLHRLSEWHDRRAIQRNKPGTILAIRLQK